MKKEIEKKIQSLKEEMERLEQLAYEDQDPNHSIEYRYCIIRELAGYGDDDWNTLVEWAKRQKGYMHLTMDPDNSKEAFYFNATPNALTILGLDRAGLYISTSDNFGPRIIRDIV